MSLANNIEIAMTNSLKYLEGTLRVSLQESETHRAVIIDGWNDDQSTRQAIAHYLVGLRACAIDAALRIRALLDDTVEDQLEILGNVIAIVGENNNITNDRKEDERNPWIAEGIWHMCLAIAPHRNEIHPNGNIVALDYPHIITKDHGLDVSAIYEKDNLFGLSLVESKAYSNNLNKAINDAVIFFREIDDGKKHAARIRQTVQVMRSALSVEQQAKISASFWKQERTYLPNPHYLDDGSQPVTWTNTRSSFRSLKPKFGTFDRLNIIVMPHAINDFSAFFDNVSDEMRNFANEIKNV